MALAESPLLYLPARLLLLLTVLSCAEVCTATGGSGPYNFTIIATGTFMQACNDTTTAYSAAQAAIGLTVNIACLSMDSPDSQVGLIRARSHTDVVQAESTTSALKFNNGTMISADNAALLDSITLFLLRTPLTAAESAKYKSTFASFPLVLNGALIAHNILELTDNNVPLNITQDVLGGIFDGTINTLCDSRFLADNKFLKSNTTFYNQCLPPGPTNKFAPISFGFRSDRYLTTLILTRALYSINPKAFAPAWGPDGLQSATDVLKQLQSAFPATYMNTDSTPKTKRIFLSSNAGLGLYAWMTATPYAMIIAPQEDVEKYGASTARIQNLNPIKEFTTCNQGSMQAAMDSVGSNVSMQLGTPGFYITNIQGPGVYPLIARSYIGFTVGKLGYPFPTYPECDDLAASIHFVKWLIDDTSGAPAPQILIANYFVLQVPMIEWYRTMFRAFGNMRCGDRKQSVLTTLNSMVAASVMYTTMHEPGTWGGIIGGLVVAAIVCFFASRSAYAFINRLRKESMEMYIIRNKEIRITPTLLSPVDRYKGVVASRKVVDRYIPTASLQCLSTGTWGEHEVFLRPCSLVLHKLSHAAKMRVLELAEISHHKNVVAFYGLTELPNGRCLVCNFCPFGDLRTLIIAKKYKFTMNIKFSIAGDICEGMKYLHQKRIVHGNLRSCAVYVEANWTAKVSDYEYDTLHQMQGSFHPTVCQLKKRLNLYQQTSLYPWLYWTAPEILQQGITGREIPPLKSADIYSFGIVCSEIFSMEPAYQKYQELPYKLTPAQILNGILTADMRPREEKHTSTTPRCIIRVLEHCWQETAAHRPGFGTLTKLFRSVNSMRRHLADRIMIAAEKSSEAVKHRLGDAERRLARFDHEFHKLSKVLVPAAYWRSIYKQKLYMSMTRHQVGIIFYCNLVHYKPLVVNEDRMAKAIECINLLHQGFENLIEKGGRVYRVYKNGASFVALGNVPYGVKEDPIDSIAQLAFDFMTWAWRVKVPANLMDGFQLQIGIHSGKMAAGTLKYSTSQFFPIGPVQKEGWSIARSSAPCRILISEEFHQNLRQLAQIFIRYRIIPNPAEVFGYNGKTYWLVGMNIYRAQTLLDDIFLLDPENLEALARWYEKRQKRQKDKKGLLANDQVSVVTPLPFDYAAMTAGGTQYQVDLTPEDEKKKSVHRFASQIILAEAAHQMTNVEGHPVRISDTHVQAFIGTSQTKIGEEMASVGAHIMKTRGGMDAIPTRATIVLHREAEDERSKTDEFSQYNIFEDFGGNSKDAAEAIKRLRGWKKKEYDELDQKRREQADLRQRQHALNEELGVYDDDLMDPLLGIEPSAQNEATSSAVPDSTVSRRASKDFRNDIPDIVDKNGNPRPRMTRRPTIPIIEPGDTAHIISLRRKSIQPELEYLAMANFQAELEKLKQDDGNGEESLDHQEAAARAERIRCSIEKLRLPHGIAVQPASSKIPVVEEEEAEPVGFLQRQLMAAAQKYMVEVSKIPGNIGQAKRVVPTVVHVEAVSTDDVDLLTAEEDEIAEKVRNEEVNKQLFKKDKKKKKKRKDY